MEESHGRSNQLSVVRHIYQWVGHSPNVEVPVEFADLLERLVGVVVNPPSVVWDPPTIIPIKSWVFGYIHLVRAVSVHYVDFIVAISV